ncbi:beta-ketoacyl synthase N-terminal-like domain-containing protein [Micromonospora sp. DT48]|uniref:beta-ketoacyl synthase N-terminal-like domain-containing protein n=1 Tax=Micromonospora sp. DT48 TaxID=3393429 RepID=UPI003CEC3DE2
MAETAAGSGTADTLRRALRTITDLKQRLAQAQQAQQAARAPIAVTGLACRFPGADGPEAYWRLLSSSDSGIVDIPEERWSVDRYYADQPGKPGRTMARRLGLVTDLERFDHGFFGIGADEASDMDPQQRLALEQAWLALEDAGIDPTALAGTRTGVFTAVCTYDFALSRFRDVAGITAHSSIGTAHGAVAGRISYTLGLAGPSLSVDTACSSSLVALHLACRSLRDGECDLALVGGVNALVSPSTSIAFSQPGMVSRSSESRPFDERADGPVIGEGCGFVVLQRRADAERDERRVRGLILGSAVNHNGRTASLTTPSVDAQRQTVAAALEAADVSAADLDYVEAHASGTPYGDIMEVEALAGLTADRDRPLFLGSCKGHVGHLQAAGGMAALLKLLLSMEHGRIPATLGLERPNPGLPPAQAGVELVTAARDWLSGTERRIAGASAFGFTGTNCHIVVAAADPIPPRAEAGPSGSCVLALSGRDERDLQRAVAAMRTFLAEDPTRSWPDVARSWNCGRTHWGWRTAVVASDPLAAAEALRTAPAHPPVPSAGIALHLGESLIPDTGWAETLRSVPLLAALDEQCRAAADGASEPVIRQCVVARALLAVGVVPTVVTGVGVGEIVAAYVAGAIDLAGVVQLVSGAVPPAGVAARTPEIPWAPASLGRLWPWQEVPGSAQWQSATREPARWPGCFDAADDLDTTGWLAIGADPAADDPFRRTCQERGRALWTVGEAAGGPGEWWWRTLGWCYELGASVDWRTALRGVGHVVGVPTHGFDREVTVPFR